MHFGLSHGVEMVVAVLLLLYFCFQLIQEIRVIRSHQGEMHIARMGLYGLGVVVDVFWMVKVCWSAYERKEVTIKSIRPITSKMVQ